MAETVTIGGKTYTKPANAKAGWLAAARKTTPVATDAVNTKPVETTATTEPVTTTATPIKSSVESKPVQPAIDRNSAAYKELTSMGYTEQQIIDAAARVKKPTATPQVDVSVEQEKLDKAKAGINPAINQQTGLVEGVKLETAKEKAIGNPDYQDESVERLTELQSNLEQYDKLAPQNFSSYETFKKAFDYNGRVQKQKDVLDSFWQKRSTPVQTDFWAGKSDDDITNSYLSGSLTDKDLSDLYNSNPERYGLIKEKIDKANTYNDANSYLSGGITKFTATEAPKTDKTLLEQYEEFMSSSDILKREADLATKKGEIDLIDEKIANMKDTIVAQYEGKGMSGDVLDAIIADRVEALNKDKRTKTIGYNADLNIYNTLVSDAQKKIDLVEKQSGIDNQKFQQQLALFQTNYGIQKDQREYELQLQQIDQGKYGAISDGFGGITVWNTKTGEIQGNNSSSQFNPTEYQDSGGNLLLNIPRTGNNVGADTNNFGNITSAVSGSIGMYKSPNGRSYAVFANAEDGYNALVSDLKAKQSGNTKTGLNQDSTIEQLLGTWVNGKGTIDTNTGYYKSFLKESGLKPGTKIGGVDTNSLARGIMAGEGTLSAYQSGGKDLGQYRTAGAQTQSQPYSAAQMSFMDNFDPTDKTQTILLGKQYGLTPDDVSKYKASKILSGTDFETALNSLSPLARDIVKGNKSLSDIGYKEKTAISEELSNAGISDFGLGNQDYWGLKDKDKTGLRQYMQIADRLAIIDDMLDNGTNTGWLKNLSEWGRNVLSSAGVGTIDTDFNTLKTEAGKNLVTFIKNISGVAVSNEERLALQQLIPSATTMSTDKFKDSLNQFKREYETLLNGYASDYGFDSIDAMRTAMGMALNESQTPNLSGNSYIQSYDDILSGGLSSNDVLSQYLGNNGKHN